MGPGVPTRLSGFLEVEARLGKPWGGSMLLEALGGWGSVTEALR
jgi:hypothetical protein